MLTAIKKVNQLNPAPSIHSVMVCGIRSAAKVWANNNAFAMMNISITVVFVASKITRLVSSPPNAGKNPLVMMARFRPQMINP